MIHVTMVMKERMGQNVKQGKAVLFREVFISSIVQGAGQSATGLSHFVLKPKDEQVECWKFVDLAVEAQHTTN